MTYERKCPCGKDMFPSKHSAATACRTMGNTFRIYLCKQSGTWHVTKQVDPGAEDGLSRKRRVRARRIKHGE